MENYNYHSEQIHTSIVNGQLKEKRNIVNLKNGSGTKTVILRENGKTRKSTHKLTPTEKEKIKNGIFVERLFKPCYDCLRTKSKSRSRTQKKKASS
jgi:hypothetical protein